MSQKFDRARQTNAAALQVLKASVRQKPWWMPKFLWRPIYWCAALIVFK